MKPLSRQDWVILLTLTSLALIVGLITGALAWCLLVAVVIWNLLQFQEFRHLNRWAMRPIARPTNQLDSWYLTSNAPYQFLRRERGRSRNLLIRLRELSTLLQAIPDASVIIGPNGEIEEFNRAAEKLLRLTDRDRGLGLATVVRHPDFVGFLRDQISESQVEMDSPFDPERTLEARRFPVEGGRIIVLVRDITELNRVLTMRQDFVANVSHELRTPLTVMAGYLETINDASEPTDVRLDLVTRLDAPLKRMRNLVDDLLLLTRLESTPPPTELQSLALEAVVTRAVAEVSGLQQRPDQIRLQIDTATTILGVETELYSVCLNLLTNALRYSPEGGDITVSLSCQDDQVRFAVADTGLGIAAEHLHRITERFYRVDLADARTRGGTGLGLAIVKHVLKRHGSKLQVTSSLGEGSTFFCHFNAITAQDYDQSATAITNQLGT